MKFFTVLFILYASLFSDQTMNFLNIPSTAQVSKAGSLQSENNSGVIAAAQNSADLSKLNGFELSYNHLELFSGIRRDFLAVGVPLKSGVLGGGADIISVRRLNQWKDGVKLSETSAFGAFKSFASYARSEIDKPKFGLSWGAGFFIAREHLENYSRTSGGFQTGLTVSFLAGKRPNWLPALKFFNKNWHNIVLGLSVINMGREMNQNSKRAALPAQVSFGAGYTPWKWLHAETLVSVMRSDTPLLSFGVKLLPFAPVQVTAAIDSRLSEKPSYRIGISAALPMGWTDLNIDYTMKVNQNIENSHFFGVRFSENGSLNSRNEAFKENYTSISNDLTLKSNKSSLPVPQEVIETVKYQVQDDKLNQGYAKLGQKQIAILPFIDITETKNWAHLEDLIEESLYDELKVYSNTTILPNIFADSVIKKLGIPANFTWKKNSLEELGRLIDADVLIYGTFEELEDRLILNYRVINGRNFTIIAQSQEDAAVSRDYLIYVDKICGKILIDIGKYLQDN